MSRKEIKKKMKRGMDRMAVLEGFYVLGECQIQVIKGIIKDLLTYFKSDDIA